MRTPHKQMQSLRMPTRLALAFFCLFAIFLPAVFAARADAQLARASQGTADFTIADFDGDNRPDFASVQVGQISAVNSRYWIGFRLSSGSQQTLGITAPVGGLQLISRDVNGDTFLDVIVTTAWTNRPVAVLLNDGHGSFIRFDPAAFPGVMRNSEIAWNSRSLEIRGAAVGLLSRSLSGNCESGGGSSPTIASGPLAPWFTHQVSNVYCSSFLGRAPPSSVLFT